jgi:hypothetical protein
VRALVQSGVDFRGFNSDLAHFAAF